MTDLGLFAQYEPAYAEHGITAIPCSTDAKRPLVKNYLSLGPAAAAQLVPKFSTVNAIGVVTGRHNRITVLDIDTTDERVLKDALDRHGEARITLRQGARVVHDTGGMTYPARC
jgi:hypothetical protein